VTISRFAAAYWSRWSKSHQNVGETVAASGSAQSLTTIGSSFRNAPSGPLRYSSSRAGQTIAAPTGSPSTTAATAVPNARIPRTKLFVPSMGSTIQAGPDFGTSFSSSSSSPTTGSSG
jgi:hypothetical protein